MEVAKGKDSFSSLLQLSSKFPDVDCVYLKDCVGMSFEAMIIAEKEAIQTAIDLKLTYVAIIDDLNVKFRNEAGNEIRNSA